MLIVRVQHTTEAQAAEVHHVLTELLRVHQDRLQEAATAAHHPGVQVVHIPEVAQVAQEVPADLIQEVVAPVVQEVLAVQVLQEVPVEVADQEEDNYNTAFIKISINKKLMP